VPNPNDPSRPLSGRTVLFTGLRPGDLGARLAELGARLEAKATIAIEPLEDSEQARSLVGSLGDYDLLVFTSANGAQHFARLLAGEPRPVGARVAAVGEATARALAEIGLPASIVAREGRADSLAALLVEESVRGARVLVVRPERGLGTLTETLRRAGALVDEVALYRTVPSAAAAAVAVELVEGRYDAVVFTSPSSFEFLLGAGGERLRAALARVRRIAIGPTTAARLADAGLPAHRTAERPSSEAIASAILAVFVGRERVGASMADSRPTPSRAGDSEREAAPVDVELKKTPLYDEHRALGARMAPFAGFWMPIQYSSLIEEHRAVRTAAGLFDVSHMGEIELEGPDALALLQGLTSNDVARLSVGRVQYNVLLNEAGGIVDDLLVYRTGETAYLLVVNAANIEKDERFLRAHQGRFHVNIENRSADWAQLALQGPLAAEILQPLSPLDLSQIRTYAFARGVVAGVPSIVSRTGYTGEDGFELYAPAQEGVRLWRALLEAGSSRGLRPCGLGARDTLRLEARMLLYGADMDETTTPLEADLGWIVKLGKGEFLGREVLERQQREGLGRKLVGFEMEGRAIARRGYPVFAHGKPAGSVTSGSYAPFLEKNIGLVYLPLDGSEPGTRIEVEVRGRRETAVVVPTPFYRRRR